MQSTSTASLLLGALALTNSGSAFAQTFSADNALATDNTGESGAVPGAENRAAQELSSEPGPVPDLRRQNLIPVGSFQRTCDCFPVNSLETEDIRGISDQFAADGDDLNAAGLTNMVWGFGQFVDHDLTLTIEDDGPGTPTFDVGTVDPDDPMELHRAFTFVRPNCPAPLNIHTPQIDGGPIYGSDEEYVQSTLRQPESCRLRTSTGNLLPVSNVADSEGRFFLLAGDVRVGEHSFLTAQHHTWLREHNRICDAVADNPDMSTDAKFDLVRNVIIAKFQQIILTEFLPALGITQADLEGATRLINTPGVSAEFGIAYRLGHDLIGSKTGDFDIGTIFNAEEFYLRSSGPTSDPTITYRDDAEQVFTDIMQALSTTRANEIDGKLSNALRNMLLSQGEDLAGRNIFRGRDIGVPTYAGVAECFGLTPDAATEAQTPDLWLGLLREPKSAGAALPPTLRAVLVEQFHRSFFGPGGFYWRDNLSAVGSFVAEIDGTRYSDIIRNATGATVPDNVFLQDV